jgi:hypothetical protein
VALCVLAVAVAVGIVTMAVLTSDLRMDVGFLGITAAVAVVYAAIAAVIIVRTGHLMGWLLFTIGIGFPLGILGERYIVYVTVVRSAAVPPLVPRLLDIGFAIASMCLTLILLLFPTGRPRSRRWRPLIVATPVATGLWLASWLLRPGPLNGNWNDFGVRINNPIGVRSLAGILELTLAVGVGASLLISAAAIACVVMRARRSTGTERQQVKWFALIGVVILVLFLGTMVVGIAFGEGSASDVVWMLFFSTLLFGIPAAIGVAILRYGLYDIDRIISRTLSYAAVTAVLGGTFALVVLVPTGIVGRGGHTPDWVIAVATLAVAALFRPVRRRVQDVVDHRFNRRRYDAEHTIEVFSQRLREQIDIDALGTELCAVVNTTMQPSRVSLWLPGKP